MKLPFVKMHGLGNDYVYINCFSQEVAKMLAKADLAALARRISDRHFGVGSDGLVLILPSQEADAGMRIFNADGSEAEMCGNAIRCVGKYLYESGLCRKLRLSVLTLAGIRSLTLQVENEAVQSVTVNMGIPQVQSDVLMRGDYPQGFTAVNMGNPHAVFFRDTVYPENMVADYGRRIENHPHFPKGTNVEFAHVRNKKEIDVRVWERGAGVTLACGTGACAAAVTAMWHGWTERKITVHLPGGDLLIQWERERQPVYMTGPATEVFRGEFDI